MSPALSNQVVVLLQTTDVEGNRFLKHPLYSKPVYYSHHASLGHCALCSRGEGTRDGVRGKQSQALGTSPPSPQPCCARGRCAREEAPVSCRRGTGRLGFAGAEEQTGGGATLGGSGSLALESVPTVCSFPNAARPTSCACLARPSPTARKDRARRAQP